MGEAEPTPEGLATAREVLRRHPDYAAGRNPDDLVQSLARFHAEVGDSRFRLLYRLREPANELEAADREHFAGVITFDQWREVYRAWQTRPVDERMIDELMAALDNRVVAVGRFVAEVLTQSRELMQCGRLRWDEARIERLLAAVTAKLPLFDTEILTVSTFLADVREVRGLGLAQAGNVTKVTAAHLALSLTDTAEQFWSMAAGRDARRTRPISPAGAYHLLTGGQFPKPADIQALLYQEHAAARVVLRERSAIPLVVPTAIAVESLTIQSGRCEVRTDTVAVAGGRSQTPPDPKQSTLTRLHVGRWTELALGIDEHREVWAVTPVPEPGGRFPKNNAVCLPLKGKRWSALLELAAKRPDGRTIDRLDLERDLGLLCPPSQRTNDGRARPGAVETGRFAVDGMREKAGTDPLRQTLNDLRRELRELVDGPNDKAGSLLVPDDTRIDTGFTVRCLCQDDSGHTRFGVLHVK